MFKLLKLINLKRKEIEDSKFNKIYTGSSRIPMTPFEKELYILFQNGPEPRRKAYVKVFPDFFNAKDCKLYFNPSL